MSLFSSLTLRGVTIPNRVVISPMSQYRAAGGYANDWHFAHLARFALGGAGLVFTEATGVEARGRRTPGDLGLWEDGQIEGLARIAAFLEAEGAVPGIQLGHAGRKASERRPWHGETPVDQEDIDLRGEHPWEAIGPSAEPYGEQWPAPKEMDQADIDGVIAGFRDAARRARDAGYKVINVYAGHGFLLHQFYSPVANKRTDKYGGSRENRMRLSVEVAEAIRETWPAELPLMFRISAVDWVDGGWTIEDSIALAKALKAAGVDAIDCSSGAIGGAGDDIRPQRMTLAQGFQVPFAKQIKREADIATMAVGFIWRAAQADEIVRESHADLVALAREVLNNPNWPLHAARELGLDDDFARWKPEFGWWLNKRKRIVTKLGLREG